MIMERILAYLTAAYKPHAILVYGSFADGTNNAHSDFDALIITDQPSLSHDGSIMDGTPLDVFIYPTSAFEGQVNYEDFLQLHDASILVDDRGVGFALKQGVLAYLRQLPPKSREELVHLVEWCEKMLLRATRNDAEGYFRWHWLLTESLELYCHLCGRHFFGPKKALAAMELQDHQGFALYSRALSAFQYETAKEWVTYLRDILDCVLEQSPD